MSSLRELAGDGAPGSRLRRDGPGGARSQAGAWGTPGQLMAPELVSPSSGFFPTSAKPRHRCNCFHFTDEKTEAQKGSFSARRPRPGLHSWHDT